MYEKLEGIGLTKSEILVYTALLKIGNSSTGSIVKEAKISSGKIYEILDRLIEKGLVTHVLENRVKHFSATDPEKIKDYIKKRKQELQEKEKSVNELIPSLKNLMKSHEKEYSAEIHSGFEGFKISHLDLIERLNKNDEILFLGGSGEREEKINLFWFKVGNLLRERKIKCKFLVTDTSKESKNILKKFKRTYPKVKYKFLEGFHLAPITICKNQILIINFEDISVISIKNKTIAEQFGFFFKSLWKLAKP